MPHFTHIFRTGITTDDLLAKLTLVLNNNPDISRWHVDMDDVDKVLKVETKSLTEEYIIALAKERNITCEVLPD